jgi:prevent-host-death family protein
MSGVSYILKVDDEDGQCRQANHDFSELLSRVERGEEILITRRSRPVALLSPYQLPRLTPEREAAINHAIEVIAQGHPGARPYELSRAMKCTSDASSSTPPFRPPPEDT